MIYSPLTKLQCSPTSDGAAAAIVCSEKFVLEHGLQGQAIEIIGQSMKTDLPSAFEGSSRLNAHCQTPRSNVRVQVDRIEAA